MPPALRIEALWKSYSAGVRGCSVRVWALRGLSLTLGHGERVAIVGAPGAGKTTLATCILGLRRPDAGLVEAWGIADGSLAVVGSGCRFDAWDPATRRPGTFLILTEDAACVRSSVDRVLLLRAGQLLPFHGRAPVRRVAEQPIGQRTPGAALR